MKKQNIVAYETYVSALFKNWEQIEQRITESGFDRNLNHLVKLRASQINGCAFCVQMHTSEARRDGESEHRLDKLVVWRHVKDFTAAERAALAWTEALTTLNPMQDYAILRQELLACFDEREISLLTSIIVMINLWNRLAVSRH